MPIIRFACPQCQRVLKVGDKFAGRQAKCPGCQTPVTVPLESDASLPEAPTGVVSGSAAPAPRRPTPAPPLPAPRRPAAPRPPDDDPFRFGNDDAVSSAPARRPAAPAAPPEDDGFAFDGADGAAVSTALAGPLPSTWKSVRTGARLVQIGVYIKLGVLVLGLLFLVLMFIAGAAFVAYLTEQMGSRSGPRPRSSYGDSSAEMSMVVLFIMLALFALLLLASFSAEVLYLIGAIMFLQVPDSTGAKGLAITALICQCFVAASPFLGCLGGMVDSSVSSLMNLMQLVANVTWFVMLLLFLHKIGSYLQSAALCKEVVRFAIWCGVTVGIFVGAVCLWFAVMFALIAGAATSSSSSASRDFLAGSGIGALIFFVLLALILLGVMIAWLLKYAQLMGTTQSVITRRAGKAAGAD